MKQFDFNHISTQLRISLPSIFLALLILMFSSWLMTSTFTYENGNFLISSRLWSDFGAHLPLIRSFSRGDNFPPQYPHFAHEPIQYHYGFYLISGLLEKMGMRIDWAVNLPSLLGFGLLLWMIYLIAHQITGKRIAGILAILLFCFNGSLTFIDYFRDNGFNTTSITSIPALKEFVNFGPWNGDHISAFWNLNIYTNQRHLGLSYALALIMLWPLFSGNISKKNKQKSIVWIAMVLALSSISPLIHKAIVPITTVAYMCWGLCIPKQLRYILPMVGLMLLVSIPLYRHVTPFAEILDIHPGYLAQGNTFWDWITYWIWNVGAYLVVIPLALVIASRKIKALILASLVLFGVANIFQMSTDMINNHKLINFALVLWAIVAADLATRVSKVKLIGIPMSLCVIAILSFSGVLDLAPISNDRLIPLADAVQSQTQQWILNNTPKQSVFLSSHKFYNPASLAGRLLYFGYSYFPWSMGYDIADREALTREIFAPTTSFQQSCDMLVERDIDYVIISSGAGEIGDTNVQVSSIVQSFEPIYQNEAESHTIYSVSNNCAGL